MRIQSTLFVLTSGLALAWFGTTTQEADCVEHVAIVTPEVIAPLAPKLVADAPLIAAVSPFTAERTAIASLQRELSSYAAAVPAPMSLIEEYSLPKLVLPSGLLLDAEATDEHLAEWHLGRSSEELVRLTHRLQKYQEQATARTNTLGPEHPTLDEYREHSPTVIREASWLQTSLHEQMQQPYTRTLPVRLGEDDEDFTRQYGLLGAEDLAVAGWDVEHAFQHEKRRHAKKLFDSGKYDERLRSQINSWQPYNATYSVRVVTKEDGKQYEQTVDMTKDEYPQLHALAEKSIWLRNYEPFNFADGPVQAPVDALYK